MHKDELSPKKLQLLSRLLAKQGIDSSALPIARLRRMEEPGVVSFSQEQLWTVHRLDPESPAYNVHVTLPLESDWDVDVVRAALHALADRHEVLRSAYPEVDGRPTLVVGDAAAIPVDFVDLRSGDAADRRQAFEALSRRTARAPFDLLTGPLVRATVVRLTDAQQVLLATMHHVVTDGWSMGIFARELQALAAARHAGRASSLAPLEVQYQDYAAWQRAVLGEERQREAIDYWTRQLAGVTPLDLPSDRRRPAVPSYEGGVESLVIDGALTEGLRALARRTGVTLFSVLLAGYKALLRTYTGHRDLVVGVPVANRDRAEVQPLIGLFVNMVAVRSDVDPSLPFTALVNRVHQATADALAHQHLPFERVVSELGAPRDPSRNPVFQTVFNVLEESTTLAGTGASAAAIGESLQTTRFDLEAHLFDARDALRVSFVSSSDLFAVPTVRRLLAHYVRLLREAVAAPDVPVTAASLLGDGERTTVVDRWNTTGTEYPADASVPGLFASQVHARPEAIALECAGEALTYRQLDARANQIARALRAAGVTLDQPVGVCLERGTEQIAALLGILKAGGGYVALDPADPPARLATLSADASLRVVVTTGTLLPDVLPGVQRTEIASTRHESSDPLDVVVPPDALAYIAFTSGSTGRPKGVVVPHRAVLRLLFGANYVELGPGETLLQLAPVNFDASTLEIWGALLHGGRLVIAPERVPSPAELGHIVAGSGVSTMWLTSSLFNTVIDQAPQALSGVRQLLVGGEALSVPHVRRALAELPGTVLINGYGPTENTTFSACHRIPRDLPADAASVPIGRPISHTQAYVLDADGAVAPVGVAGELYVGGAGLARGYAGAPRYTAERFVPDAVSGIPGRRLYRTGDIVRWREDGTLEFLGRRDDQIKLRGYRIELGEIEAALAALPGVAAACAVIAATAGSGRVVGFVVPADDVEIDTAAARAELQARLPHYMVPATIGVLPALPLTPNGKVDRRALAAAAQMLEGDAGAYEAPRTPVETALAGIWADVLKLPRVGVHDNFFELGGDSILSLQIVARAREAGLRLKARDLFQYATVAELAGVATAAGSNATARADASGPAPLTPIQRWFLDADPVDPHHFNQALLLRLRADVDAALVVRAVDHLVEHHDVLRATYRKTADGWEQTVAPRAAGTVVERVDLSVVAEADRAAAMLAASTAAQTGFDLAAGPLFRALHIDLGASEAPRLLLVAHHLVVDGVSWRILADDLNRAYEQLARGDAPSLPSKTTSYREWSLALTARAAQVDEGEAEYWARTVAPVSERRRNITAKPSRAQASLAKDETDVLLRRVPAASDARIDEVLLAAFLHGYREASGAVASGAGRELLVDLEAHGRAELDGVDVSRTVGWFTAIYPVRLTIPSGGEWDASLREVRERLRAVPHGGLGYGLLRYLGSSEQRARLTAAGDPPVSFNYLGQFDQLLPDGVAFRPASDPVGPLQSVRLARRHALDVVAFVIDGQLHLELSGDGTLLDDACTSMVAETMAGTLRHLVARTSAAHGARVGDAIEASGTFADSHVGTSLSALLEPALTERIFALYPDAQDAYPVTPMQHGMLFHTLLHPNDGTYTEVFTCRLDGTIDEAAFQSAWRAIVARHDVLRSVFVCDGVETPIQVVRPAATPEWTLRDWRDLDAAAQERELSDWLDHEERTGFDLARGPLLRLALLRTSDRSAQFVWSFHHAILDGWSLAIVLSELGELYDAALEGRQPALPAPQPYGEYVRWLADQDRESARRYWQSILRGVDGPTPLGVDRQVRAGDGQSETRQQTVVMPDAAVARIRQTARTQKVTLNTLLQGAWARVLSAYSGHRDVVFGMTVAGRPAELAGEARLGLFINTVPVRVDVTPEATAGDYLRLVQQQQLAQREHEHLALVDIARCSGVPHDAPLFESILVFENYPIEASGTGGAGTLVASHAEARHRSNFPLALVVSPARGLTLRAIYDASRFDDAAIGRLLAHVQTVLEAIATGPAVRLRDVSIAAPQDVIQVVRTWNDAARDYPERSIPELFAARVAEAPDAPALDWRGRQTSYAELDRRANGVARALAAVGVGVDARVGVLADRGPRLIAALVGIVKAGAAYVAVDPAEPPLRAARQLEDAGVQVVLSDRNLPSAFARWPLLQIDAIEDAAAAPDVHVPPDALAYVAFTSGSTGRPKGVEVPHRAVVRLLFGSDFVTLGRGESILQLAPVSFDASTLEIWGALLHGGRLVIYPERLPQPSELGDVLARTGVTTAWLTSSLFNAVIEQAPMALRTLRQLLIGGEALSVPHVRRGLSLLPETTIVNGYGPTENTTFTCCYRIPRDLPSDAGSVPLGGPIANTQTFVLDADGAPVPVGVPGELFVGGAGLARGYAASPRLTAERFLPDAISGAMGARLYRTGDIVRWRQDGTLEFLGRRDGQIKLRGFRIELGEVESALASIDEVAAAAAVVRDVAGSRQVVAYVVPRTGAAVDAKAVRDQVARRLPAYMVPGLVVPVASLPLTATGKVDRGALPDPDRAAASPEAVPPRNDTEREVARLWSDVLQLNAMSVTDDFFERGGHSLLATQVVSRLRQRFGIELPLVCLFEARTIEALAVEIDRRRGTAAPIAEAPVLPVSRDTELPLSPAQQRLWFLDQLNPGSSAYNVPAALRIQGRLDLEGLERAFGEIVRRHEVLRTAIGSRDGRAFQVVEDWAPFRIRRVDARRVEAPEREQTVRSLAAAEALTPFDLRSTPLIRATAIQLADEEHVLVIVLHHIACDAWSLGVMVRELTAFYQAFTAGGAVALPPLAVQFADFASWQAQRLAGGEWQRQLEHWGERLAGAPALDLPTDRPRPPSQTFNGSHVLIDLPAGAVDAMRRLAGEEGATFFMAMTAAFTMLLHRSTGQRDISIGTPVAYRPRPELEPLIGFFSNTLVLRTALAPRATFRDILRTVRAVAEDAYAHQDVPFEQVVEHVQPQRHLDRNPLFQVLFTLQHAPVEPLSLPGLRLEPIEIERMSVRLDLEVHVGESRRGPIAAFYYNADLFEHDTIARMASLFAAIVERVAASPDAVADELEVLPVAQAAQLTAWQGVGRPVGELTLQELVEAQVRRTPDAVAIEFRGTALTYRELDARANRLARWLRANGVGPDDRVAIGLPRSVAAMVAVLAVMKAGGAYLPLDPAYPAERLRYMLADSGARVLLADDDMLEVLGEVDSAGCTVRRVDPDEDICPDGDAGVLPRVAGIDHLAYVLYTSGSTGRPKGVALPHRALVNLLEWQVEVSGPGVAGRTVQYAPLSFDPSFLEMFSAWTTGGTLVLLDEETRRDFMALVRFLDCERIERLYITPAALHQLAEASQSSGVVPRSLREINAAGERLEVTAQIAWMCAGIDGCVLFNQYGPTESHVVTCERLDGPVGGWPALPTIGRPLPNTRMHILDRAGNAAPIGAPGELFIAGDCLARGYVGRPRLTAERFLPDPQPERLGDRLYRTGDLARYRVDGTIEYLGRVDDQVKLRGYRIELGEIESVLARHPQVFDAVVAVRELAPGARHLVAYVVPRDGAPVDARALRAHVASYLPEYMVPSAVQALDALPLTPSGKINRAALPAPELATPDAEIEAPRNPTEVTVAAIWSETLGVGAIGIHDNFFEAGGHSLLAAQVVARVRREWGLELPIRSIFECPTIAALAERVQTLQWAANSQAVAATVAAGREEGEL